MSLIGLYAPTLKPSILAAWFVEISEGWMWLRRHCLLIFNTVCENQVKVQGFMVKYHLNESIIYKMIMLARPSQGKYLPRS